jgi:hypothetical protein
MHLNSHNTKKAFIKHQISSHNQFDDKSDCDLHVMVKIKLLAVVCGNPRFGQPVNIIRTRFFSKKTSYKFLPKSLLENFFLKKTFSSKLLYENFVLEMW